MEDVFELLRQRTSGLPVEAIDTVFACLDALSASVEAIESDGKEALDPAPLITRLRSLVRPRTPEQQKARVGLTDPLDQAAVLAAHEAGARVLRVLVTLSDEVLMPAVRAHMVLAALTDHGEVLASAPAPDAVEHFQGREIEAWIASDHEDETIAANVREISEVVEVKVKESRSPGSRPRRPRPRSSPPPPEPLGRPSPTSRRPPHPNPRPRPRPHPHRHPHPLPVSRPKRRSRPLRHGPCASTPSASTR